MKQAATRIDEAEYELFKQTAMSIGTTPADALRMFIYAFNDHRGFPYPVVSRRTEAEPFETEEEATAFATDLALETFRAAR